MNDPLLYAQLRCTLHHPLAKLPTRGAPGSAGLDLYAAERIYGEGMMEYDTGVSVEIPVGYVGLMFARSSVSKMALRFSTGASVIDQDFRGTIKVRFDYGRAWRGGEYIQGDRIAQLVIVPYLMLEPVQVEELSQTERGTGGFGSTDVRHCKTLTPEDGQAFKDGCDQLSDARKANEELKSYTQAVTE